jgi:uncharacterized protein YcgL (UPF0745 family)
MQTEMQARFQGFWLQMPQGRQGLPHQVQEGLQAQQKRLRLH